MATLTNKNQWYDVATAGPYTSTISGYNVTWYNVIQARWTNLSGTTYTTQYRCLVRKTGGSNSSNTSSYNGYSIGGTGATTSSASNVTISYPNVGDNIIATVTGTVNGTFGTVTGGVKLGYYGTTWGSTSLSGNITLPSLVPTPDLTGIGVTTTTATVGWFVDDGEGSINGTGYIYAGTTPSPTTQVFTTTLKNDVFVDTGLTQGVTYYYRGRIKDANDNWGAYTPDLRLTTIALTNRIYGSASGLSNLVTDIYGSANSHASRVTKIYGSENGTAKLTYQGFGHLNYP